jgi:hypothetical protein
MGRISTPLEIVDWRSIVFLVHVQWPVLRYCMDNAKPFSLPCSLIDAPLAR